MSGNPDKKTAACHPARAEWRRMYSSCGKYFSEEGDTYYTSKHLLGCSYSMDFHTNS